MSVQTIAPDDLRGAQHGAVEVTFPPGASTIRLDLAARAVGYWSRPDLGIFGDDVRVEGGSLLVTVHSLGAADAPASRLTARDRAGRVVGSADVPALRAPVDVTPKTATVTVRLAPGTDFTGGTVEVEIPGQVREITLRNNRTPAR